ncbi:hypothetical protein H7992_07205 [Sporosarcina sp. resist]|uniref:XkdQ/YqbQ family protein n=1 Tax=Sporosarcina sp. resist TaxID=2762563 RepID=UPI00164D7480|nr:hypothetical protein [Sporosarcina sp. resist]QNK89445.1 hypothetical protein H7992_07205 [Sporosarcina sp. resist]
MEVLIDNKDGVVWDMPVSSIEWKTERIGKAGTLDAKLVIEDPLKYPINNGSIIRVMDGKQKVFYGYVFESGYTRSGEVSVKAFDQLRYMMSNDTFVFKATTATAAIKKIAIDLGLKVGTFEDTGYTVPGIVEDDKKALDVALKFLDSTLIATNRNFVLFDDFGALSLKNIKNMMIKADVFYIGEDSLLFEFEYNKSIDKETYNRIKLVHDDEKKSKREVYIAQDSGSMAKFGRLQEFRKVEENMKPAQIKELAERMLKLRNRETKTLDLDCLGDWQVRAGSFVYIYIEKIGVSEYFLVDECTHTWAGGLHVMNLGVKVI